MQTTLKQPIFFQAEFVKITNNIAAGLILSQLFHLAQESKAMWICKTRIEWEQELGVSLIRLRTAVNLLQKMQLILVKRAGLPAKTFYQLNYQNIANLLSKQ